MKGRVRLNEELIRRLDVVFDKSWAKLSGLIPGIPRSTLYRVKGKPDGIGMQQLLAIANGLHIPVSLFFYEGSIHQIGKCEDYVTEPYLPCRYDYERLRHIIETSRNITWVKGYDIIGITQDNLKASLLQEDAPVNRLLKFCYGFDIDPFGGIIIDPNPTRPQRPRRKQGDEPLLSEMAEMRKDIATLTAAASDLSGKYRDVSDRYSDVSAKYDALLTEHRALLDAHKALLSRVDEQLADGAAIIGLAADAGDQA